MKLSKDEEEDWDVLWLDGGVNADRMAKMKNYQRINHFPGMYILARKNHLGRNLMRMQRDFPSDYKFFPKTWLFPSEYASFRAQWNPKKPKTYIVKPEDQSQGRGIYLARTLDQIDPTAHCVVQSYLHKPYLIDDLKFDLRIYVLLTGADPLRIYLYKEGMGRLATEPYVNPTKSNLNTLYMHLTNYAINKNNKNFIFNHDKDADDVGHKRSLTSVLQYIED